MNDLKETKNPRSLVLKKSLVKLSYVDVINMQRQKITELELEIKTLRRNTSPTRKLKDFEPQVNISNYTILRYITREQPTQMRSKKKT